MAEYFSFVSMLYLGGMSYQKAISNIALQKRLVLKYLEIPYYISKKPHNLYMLYIYLSGMVQVAINCNVLQRRPDAQSVSLPTLHTL